MGDDDVKFVAEILCRLDRANDGASTKEGTDIVIDLVPHLSREQAQRQLTRRVIPEGNNSQILKKNLQKVQAATSHRVNLNIPQQYRWHVAVDDEFKFLRDKTSVSAKNPAKHLGKLWHTLLLGWMKCVL